MTMVADVTRRLLDRWTVSGIIRLLLHKWTQCQSSQDLLDKVSELTRSYWC